MVKSSLKALQSQLADVVHKLSYLEKRVETHIFYADITAGTVRDHHAKLDKLDTHFTAEVKRLSDCLTCTSKPVGFKRRPKKS